MEKLKQENGNPDTFQIPQDIISEIAALGWQNNTSARFVARMLNFLNKTCPNKQQIIRALDAAVAICENERKKLSDENIGKREFMLVPFGTSVVEIIIKGMLSFKWNILQNEKKRNNPEKKMMTNADQEKFLDHANKVLNGFIYFTKKVKGKLEGTEDQVVPISNEVRKQLGVTI